MHVSANYNCSDEQKRLFPSLQTFFLLLFSTLLRASSLVSRALHSRAESVFDSDVVGADFQCLIANGFLSSFNMVLPLNSQAQFVNLHHFPVLVTSSSTLLPCLNDPDVV